MSITVSAPGKIHLLGEHTVVYGKPAFLAAIDKRIYVRIKNQESRIKNKNEILIRSDYGDKLIKQAINVFKKAFRIKKLPPFEISITSQIPVGSGLGSSAALSAATIGALMKFVKNLWNPIRINELSYEVEKIAHGNPSGADNTTVVFGGLVWYRREFDFLKSIWHLPKSFYKIPKLVLLDTGRPEETTAQMVVSVADLYRRNRKKTEEVFNNQEIQTKRLLLSLRNSDKNELIAAIRNGERNLEEMGVVGDLAKNVVREVERGGGCAKVCGAGGRKKGSGVLLVFCEKMFEIEEIGKKYKIPVMSVVLGGEGVRIENNPINTNNPILPIND